MKPPQTLAGYSLAPVLVKLQARVEAAQADLALAERALAKCRQHCSAIEARIEAASVAVSADAMWSRRGPALMQARLDGLVHLRAQHGAAQAAEAQAAAAVSEARHALASTSARLRAVQHDHEQYRLRLLIGLDHGAQVMADDHGLQTHTRRDAEATW